MLETPDSARKLRAFIWLFNSSPTLKMSGFPLAYNELQAKTGVTDGFMGSEHFVG